MPEDSRPLLLAAENAGHTQAIDPRRWWVLWTVAAAQFMFVVDALNVAIPTIRADLRIGAAEIEAVIAVYLIAYATLVIIGGRLGDLHGVKPVFLTGLIGFILASVWCGLARSGVELILARLVRGATAALIRPGTRASRCCRSRSLSSSPLASA
jgi:MFS family permease